MLTDNLPAHRVARLWEFQVSEVDDWGCSGAADEQGPCDIEDAS